MALHEFSSIRSICLQFPGQIIIGLDAKRGFLAAKGWTKVTNLKVFDLIDRLQNYGVNSIIYTDIGRDGMLQGIDLLTTSDLVHRSKVPIIVSGGVNNMRDIKTLMSLSIKYPGSIDGVIVGRSIYQGSLDLTEAQLYCDNGG
jgi:phosphoribosylformimino-5-aminoimidazole carboxamide ribotide isomerase